MIGLAKANRGGSTVSHILVAVMLGGLVLTTGAAVRSGAATSAANLFCELPAFGIDCPERLDERTGTDPGQLPRRADVEANGEEAGTGWSSAPWELPAPTQTATATVDFGWTKPAEGFSGKRFAIAGMAGVAPAGAATATSGGTAAAGAGSTGLAGVASLFLSGVAFFTAMVIPYPWNDTGTGERELAEGVELRWDYAQLDSLTVVGPNGDVLLSAREAANYFVLPDGLIVATKTDSGPELRSWVQERVIGGDTYENATRVAKPNASATPYPPELPKLLGFPDNSDYVSKDQGYALPVPLGALPGLAHPDLEAAGIHPGELHVDLVDRGSPLEEPIQRLRDLARPAQTTPHSSDGSQLAAELREHTQHIAADARARDREVATGDMSARESMEQEVDNTANVYDFIPTILGKYGVEAEEAFVPVPEGMMETPNQSRSIIRILSATNERFQELLDLRDQLEREGWAVPELVYEPARADLATDATTWKGPDGRTRIAMSTVAIKDATEGRLVGPVRALLEELGQTARSRADAAHRFGTVYRSHELPAGNVIDFTEGGQVQTGDAAVLRGEAAAAGLAHALSKTRDSSGLPSLSQDPNAVRGARGDLGWVVLDAREAVELGTEQRARNAAAIAVLRGLESERGLLYDPSLPEGFRVTRHGEEGALDSGEATRFQVQKEAIAELSGAALSQAWRFKSSNGGAVEYDELPFQADGQSSVLVSIYSPLDPDGGTSLATFVTLPVGRFPTEVGEVHHDSTIDYLEAQQESLRQVVADASVIGDQASAMRAALEEYRENHVVLRGLVELQFAREDEASDQETVQFRANDSHTITYRKHEEGHTEATLEVYLQSGETELARSRQDVVTVYRARQVQLRDMPWDAERVGRIRTHPVIRETLRARQRQLEQAWQAAIDGE